MSKKKYRKAGIGYNLCKEIIKKIKKEGFKKIKVAVNAQQKTALNVYKKFGFREVGRFEKEMKHNRGYYDIIYLEKLL